MRLTNWNARLFGSLLAKRRYPRDGVSRRRVPSSRRRNGVPSAVAAMEWLEERTLLSAASPIAPASLALYNGTYAGTFSGTSVVVTNGQSTTTPVAATAFQSTINDGAITVTGVGLSGSGTVNSRGVVNGSVNVQIEGATVAVAFTGKITSADNSGTAASGSWKYSENLGNGVVVRGHGSWSDSAAQVVSDFDGNYAGSYKGSTLLNDNGHVTKTKEPVTSFPAVISNGVVQVSYPSSTGLAVGTGTIDANGNIAGTTSFVAQGGVTVTVNFSGTATRSSSGVQATGTWSFSANLGAGVSETGQGTWTIKRVLIFDGSYAGTFNGTIVDDDNGTTTTTSIPGTALSNNSVQLTILNGVVTVSVPGVPASGSGTIGVNGKISGAVTFESQGATITVDFTGKAVQTTLGNVISGTWSYTETYSNGIVENGSGTWNVSDLAAV